MGNCADVVFCLLITDEGGHGLWRLRLVERLCAAHGEPIDDPSGNRTQDGTAANVTPRVWTMADPANATAPIPADAIDRMVRCLGAFQLFLFPYVWAISIDAVCVLCIGASRRGFRGGGSHRRFTRPRASQHHGTRHANHRRGRHVIALTGVELVAGGGTRGERSRRVQPSLVLRLVRLFSNCLIVIWEM